MRWLVHQSEFSNKVKIKDAHYHNTKCPDIILPKILWVERLPDAALSLSVVKHITWHGPNNNATRTHSSLRSCTNMRINHSFTPLFYPKFSKTTLETCWMGTFKCFKKQCQPEHQAWANKTCMIKPRNIMANMTFDCIQVWLCQYHLLT
jgi:hypothetical protein